MEFYSINEKGREAVRVVEKQLIRKLTKIDKQFEKDLIKAIDTQWLIPNKRDEYLKTTRNITLTCIKSEKNKNVISKFIAQKEKELSTYYRLDTICKTCFNYLEIVLGYILREYILTSAIRKNDQPKSIYICGKTVFRTSITAPKKMCLGK